MNLQNWPQDSVAWGQPHATGGHLAERDLKMPDLRNYAVEVPKPGVMRGNSRHGQIPAGYNQAQPESSNFRMVGPGDSLTVWVCDDQPITWAGETLSYDDHLAADGRILSEHTCEGWLEGYLLTGTSWLFPAMRRLSTLLTRCLINTLSGLRVATIFPGADRSPSTTCSPHVWRQDHNGFSHQDPGFIDVVVNKRQLLGFICRQMAILCYP